MIAVKCKKEKKDEQSGGETIPGSKPKPAPASDGAGGGSADEPA